MLFFLRYDMVPYMHVQGAHAEMTQPIHPCTLGWLTNEVIERKHRGLKNLNNNQGGGRGVHKENRRKFEHDRICVRNSNHNRILEP